MKPMRALLVAAAAVVTLAPSAFAQSDIAPRSAVSVAGGFGSTTSATGVALGGAWLFDLNDRAALEAQGTYLDRGAGADALSVNGSLLVNLLNGRERIVPYAAVGGGLYRASFELANPALLGPVAAQFSPGYTVCPAPGTGFGLGPGAGFGPGTATCPADAAGYWGVGQMPGFFGRRLGPMVVPMGRMWETHSFTDPALSVGGGIRLHVNDRVMVRPDVRALTVLADGETHTIAVFGINVGYRF